MGNFRLGHLMRSRKWCQVIDLIACGADAEGVTAATLDASEQGLTDAAIDPGMVEATWLLMQLPHAAREQDFATAAAQLGVVVPADATTTDILAAVSAAISKRVEIARVRSDIGEMAEASAVSALATALSESPHLFAEHEGVRSTLKGLESGERFGHLAQSFFGGFLKQYVGYFLSRELGNHVGGARRFPTIEERRSFSEAIALHCRQVARVIREFAGDWMWKTRLRKGDVTRDDVSGFLRVAVRKLRGGLRQGERAE